MVNQSKYSRGKNPNSRKGGFKKGHTIWLGRHLSEEHKEKLRTSKLGFKNPMFGKKHTQTRRLKISKASIGKRHSEETKKIIGLKHSGDKTKTWKGDKVGYSGVHSWIRKTFGKADRCENIECPEKSKNYQWANVSKIYKRAAEDWIKLCVSCHQKWDRGFINIKLNADKQ